jgi:hypothetical protein
VTTGEAHNVIGQGGVKRTVFAGLPGLFASKLGSMFQLDLGFWKAEPERIRAKPALPALPSAPETLDLLTWKHGITVLIVRQQTAVHDHLRRLAAQELPLRTLDLARQHGIEVNRVTVRSQKTRWGSCSAQGTISLNWRIIQAPPDVRDYLIIHELMHRRQMNHSDRYWKLVAEASPGYEAAEAWLRQHRLE